MQDESTRAFDPGMGPFDDPAFGQRPETGGRSCVAQIRLINRPAAAVTVAGMAYHLDREPMSGLQALGAAPGVGSIHLELGEVGIFLASTDDTRHRPVPILHTGDRDRHTKQQAQGVDHQVTFRAFHFLAGVVATRAALRRDPRRLAIQDGGTRPCLLPQLQVSLKMATQSIQTPLRHHSPYLSCL